MPRRKSAPELPPVLPIKLGSVSNGEFAPAPVDRATLAAAERAMGQADVHARRLAVPRRRFLAGLRGVATTLMALNQVAGCRRGGSFELHPEAPLEEAAAAEVLGGDEFIFDVHMHHVDPRRPWREHHGPVSVKTFLRLLPQGRCGEPDWVDCYGADHFIKEVFLDSDTDAGVLSFVPTPPPGDPLSNEEALATRALVSERVGPSRLLTHGLVLPNLAPLSAQLDGMQRMVEDFGVRAFKLYTQWGPGRQGFWLDDPEVGLPVIERARALGVKTICVHKGLLLPGFSRKYASSRDVGVVARLYPDVDFMVYHSGYEIGHTERAFDPAFTSRGINSLVQSLKDSGIPPNANVYADLGSTWFRAMRHPTEAAHVLGKLLRYVGAHRVVWGTDSIWYGSPQDQIQAFRAFQISEQFRERFGYPKITPRIRAQVFGLNGAGAYGLDPAAVRRAIAGDEIARVKAAYRLEAADRSHAADRPHAADRSHAADRPEAAPSLATYGPRTRREFLRLKARQGPGPG